MKEIVLILPEAPSLLLSKMIDSTLRVVPIRLVSF